MTQPTCDTTEFDPSADLEYAPTSLSTADLPKPERNPHRAAGIAQSVLMNPEAPLGLWRLATELDAAFNRGEALHVTMTSSATSCWTFSTDNAHHLLSLVSSALISNPNHASGVIVRAHDCNETGAVISTGICCLFAQGETLQDGDVQGYLDAHGTLQPHERFITLAELFPDGGHATRAVTAQAQMPLELLGTLYPFLQYPADVHPAQATALSPTDPIRERGLRASADLSAQARRSGTWDLACRLDAAFLAGRDITAHIYVNGQPFVFTPDTAATVYGTVAQILQRCQNPAVLVILAERQQENLVMHGEPLALTRIAVADTTDDQLRNHPYSEIDPTNGLYPIHLITPVNTLLPPLNRPLHA